MALICHLFGLEYIYFTVVTLVIIYICLFERNGLRLIPVVLLSLVALSRRNNEYIFATEFNSFVRGAGGAAYLVVLVVLGGAAIVSLVLRNLVSRIRAYKLAKAQTACKTGGEGGAGQAAAKTKKKPNLYWGLLGLCAVFFLGGLFFGGFAPRGLLLSLSLTGVVFFVFAVFELTVKWDKDSMNYLCDAFTAMLAVVVIQMLWLYIDPGSGLLRYVVFRERAWWAKQLIYIGWAPSNQIAIIITIILPFVMYRMFTARRAIVYFVVSALSVVAMGLTLSRNGLMFGIPMYVALSVWALLRAKDRKTLRLAYAAAAIVAVIAAIILRSQVWAVADWLFSRGLDTTNRGNLARMAWEHFRRAPIFGVGFGYATGNYHVSFSLYHNHYLQFLGSMGLVGLIAYGFHRYQTIRLFWSERHSTGILIPNIFVMVSLLMFVLTSLLDITFFNPLAMTLHSIILVMLIRNCNSGCLDNAGQSTQVDTLVDTVTADNSLT